MRDAGVREAFDRLSADYDERFPRIIPRYAEFHDVIVQRVVEQGPHGTLLDLGCGTGELSWGLLRELSSVRLHCIDLSPAMVAAAREKLGGWDERVSFAVGNFLSTPFPDGAAGAVSALAVHHLEPAEKRALFRRLFLSLAPGAVLVVGDAVAGESDFYTEYYTRRWVDHMRSSGMQEAEIASVLRDHEENDRFSTLDQHLTWMREAGFERVECLWKHFLLAVVAGEKP